MWVSVGVVCGVWACVGGTLRSSDPSVVHQDHDFPQLDPANLPDLPLGNADSIESDILGEPLTPDDFSNISDDMLHDPVDVLSAYDPIMLAGLYQGDIRLGSQQELKDMLMGVPEPRNAMAEMENRWPNGVIPYVISQSFNTQERAVVAMSIKNYEELTCIRFVPRQVEQDYIHLIKGDGCSSSVGRKGGAQPVSLGPGCIYVGVVMHELMHAIGFWHEHSRPDRDKHINIVWNNIKTGMDYNFQAFTWNKVQTLGVEYDVGSIMHYGSNAFAKDPSQPTIVAKHSQAEMGQRKALSMSDKKKVNLLYCKDTPVGTGTTSPVVAGLCTDNHQYCSSWAKAGECTKNPTYMGDKCCRSCHGAGGSPGCVDKQQHCAAWSKIGECTKNPSYMSVSCQKSCGTCHKKRSDPPGAPVVCEDSDPQCKDFAASDQCRVNPEYMLVACKKSCGQC
ncbi:zinc metalloproteinase nas-4 [Procambarus clarkii]|uniref:zinc metalloproteinase nas-4 n=1 Tax=Procambarus clarkii TaxID=6728 RepID=UPI0037444ACD